MVSLLAVVKPTTSLFLASSKAPAEDESDKWITAYCPSLALDDLIPGLVPSYIDVVHLLLVHLILYFELHVRTSLS